MKNISKFLFLLSFVITIIYSCKKDEKKDYFEGGTPPVLTASQSDSIPLSYTNRDNEAARFSWTNPNYQFTTGVSSQDVTYQLEIDTTGSNFTNSKRQTVTVSKDLSKSFTQGEFNDFLLNQLQLDASVTHNIEVRITSKIGSSVPLYSNVLKYTVMPYAIPPKVAPPTTGRLYIVGNATPGGDASGWNNPVPVPSQEFTMISPTLYEITIPLIGGKEYLFLPLNGDWGHKYAVRDNTIPGLSEGGDFGFDFPQNFPGPAASGNYKISVDFQRGKFTVTKL